MKKKNWYKICWFISIGCDRSAIFKYVHPQYQHYYRYLGQGEVFRMNHFIRLAESIKTKQSIFTFIKNDRFLLCLSNQIYCSKNIHLYYLVWLCSLNDYFFIFNGPTWFVTFVDTLCKIDFYLSYNLLYYLIILNTLNKNDKKSQ